MEKEYITFALAGNPNVGKSTVFNNLTGLNQHTGNWTGKTVANAIGKSHYGNKEYKIVDLPGTYSLLSTSEEEKIACNYICFGDADAIVIVADATMLERNLNLLLQIMEITSKVVLCVNLIDEAKKKQIIIDCPRLSSLLSIPVIPITATQKKEVYQLFEAVEKALLNDVCFELKYSPLIESAIGLIQEDIRRLNSKINPRFAALKILSDDVSVIQSINKHMQADLFSDASLNQHLKEAKHLFMQQDMNPSQLMEEIVGTIINKAEEIANQCVTFNNPDYKDKDKKIDKILTSKIFGIPIMLLLLGIIFYITINLSNYPSQWLTMLFSFVEKYLNRFFTYIHMPYFIRTPFMDGIYKTTTWVIAVMLPPMAIFFPLFTFLEDLGYLPRVAFNLDRPFKNCGCCGKQSLTMCMGFGCNAVGITGTRIINSPRERLIAIMTNNFVPCNGRFPTLITISSFFIGGTIANAFLAGLVSTLTLTLIVLLGIFMTLLVSKILSKTILRGIPSCFSLDLPPFRKPQIGKIFIRSICDRTIFVLSRAVIIAIPCGLLIWLLGNIQINSQPILFHLATFLNPFANLMGMDGYILTAFILGFPANEIVIPMTIMSYTSSTSLVEINNINQLGNLLVENGWTWLTGINVLLFCLLHYPCATTMLTIKKETGSIKWTILSMIIPTIIGIFVCISFTTIIRLLGLAG